MNIITRIGMWLDKRFPERISVEEVMKSLQGYESIRSELQVQFQMLRAIEDKQAAFTKGAQAFDKTDHELRDEINKIKATLAILNRSRVQPVMPSGEPWKR